MELEVKVWTCVRSVSGGVGMYCVCVKTSISGEVCGWYECCVHVGEQAVSGV